MSLQRVSLRCAPSSFVCNLAQSNPDSSILYISTVLGWRTALTILFYLLPGNANKKSTLSLNHYTCTMQYTALLALFPVGLVASSPSDYAVREERNLSSLPLIGTLQGCPSKRKSLQIWSTAWPLCQPQARPVSFLTAVPNAIIANVQDLFSIRWR